MLDSPDDTHRIRARSLSEAGRAQQAALPKHLALSATKKPPPKAPRRTPPPGRLRTALSRIALALPPVVLLTLRRTAEAASTLIALVTLIFAAAHLAPGGPAFAILGRHATPNAVGAVDLRLGLDVPLWQQYLLYWVHLAHGDLGNSYLLNRPVASLVAPYLGRTMALYAAGLTLGAALALVGGALHGMWFGRPRGRVLAAAELTLYALPSFFVGTMLMAVFATGLGVLPTGGAADLRLAAPRLGDTLAHLVLPAVTVALALYAGLAPYFAQAVHREMQAPYARTASAKGLSPWQVARRHVFRNALRPLITLLGLSFPSLVAGSVVVESVFSYPGLGWLLWRSALSHDYPVIIGIVLLIGIATILGNLTAELVNTWLDPRSRYV